MLNDETVDRAQIRRIVLLKWNFSYFQNYKNYNKQITILLVTTPNEKIHYIKIYFVLISKPCQIFNVRNVQINN